MITEIAKVEICKKWGRGYKRIPCRVYLQADSNTYEKTYLFYGVNGGTIVGTIETTIDSTLESLSLNNTELTTVTKLGKKWYLDYNTIEWIAKEQDIVFEDLQELVDSIHTDTITEVEKSLPLETPIVYVDNILELSYVIYHRNRKRTVLTWHKQSQEGWVFKYGHNMLMQTCRMIPKHKDWLAIVNKYRKGVK